MESIQTFKNEKAALAPFVKISGMCARATTKNFRDKKRPPKDTELLAVNDALSGRNHEAYTFSTTGMNIKTSLRMRRAKFNKINT